MARQSLGGWWSHAVGRLLGKEKTDQRRTVRRLGAGRTVRRLGAEWLENRSMMSVAPLGDASGISLEDYLAQQHEMGPLAPLDVAMVAAAPSSTADLTHANSLALRSLAEGEDDGGTCDDYGNC